MSTGEGDRELNRNRSRALAGVAVALAAAVPAAARVRVGYVEAGPPLELAAPQPYPGATPTGPYVWSREIRRPGATFVKLRLAGLALAHGDVLSVTGSDGHQGFDYRGRRDAPFWTGAIRGDRAVVTLTSYSGGGPGFHIDQVGVGEPTVSPEVICGSDGREDVACFASGKARTEPVARILFEDGGDFFVCTGFLIRGAEPNTFMTAGQCVDSQAGVDTVEAWFNYQNRSCGSFLDDPISVYFGDTLIATNPELDYSLLTLTDDPEANHGAFAGTRDAPDANNRIALPQHSGGFEKEVAVFEGFNRTGGPCRIDGVRESFGPWLPGSQFNYSCDTQDGAAGAPVLGREQNIDVIGINHAETVDCFGNQGNYATHMDLICEDAGDLLDCN